MMQKTPGVYVKEISLFPPSVAEVETAIPAFIGYTQKATKKGQNLKLIPTKIKSLLEYHDLFGWGYEVDPTDLTVYVKATTDPVVNSVDFKKRFYMYEALRLFFDNGGGDCYIVSVNDYTASVGFTDLEKGTDAVKKYDEPTILLFPDAARLKQTELSSLQQKVLEQCSALQDRVGVFDLKEEGQEFRNSVDEFRDGIGINNLKYGAAYAPWLYTAYPKTINFKLLDKRVKVKGANSPNDDTEVPLDSLTTSTALNNLVAEAQRAATDISTIDDTIKDQRGNSATLQEKFKTLKEEATKTGIQDAEQKTKFQNVLQFLRKLVNGHNPQGGPQEKGFADWHTIIKGKNLKKDIMAYATSTLGPGAERLIALEKNDHVLALSDLADVAAVDTAYKPLNDTKWVNVTGVAKSDTAYRPDNNTPQNDVVLTILSDLGSIFEAKGQPSLVSFISAMEGAAAAHTDLTQKTLYEGHSQIGNIAEHVKKECSKVPPSGAVAGVYAKIDDARGVWKAPANVSLNSVRAPVETIDFFDQEDLNVDVNGGKSINAIRSFAGRGAAIIWGARTLAGNDNEWRYVPVRRFFNMVEESVKKSTAWAVFEPNAAPLWTKVKSMIDNYLIQKWREGALQGAVPEDAFFVKIGLGQTMIAQDILEGRLIVEIGMAVVRPAEFIILRFMHKLPVS